VLSRLEFVRLPARFTLNEAAKSIEFAYFINSGLASVLTVMNDGKSVGVGLTGKEGFVGVPLLVGLKNSPTRAIMQVAGSAFRIAAKDLGEVLQGCQPLLMGVMRYAQELSMQATQIAACNCMHEVGERLAWWLLISQDRLGGELVPLTHGSLAELLGTRRASVSVAAGILQKGELINYAYGSVKIRDRGGLEEAACECYKALSKQARVWRLEAK
jgi:CRP-like cAMP-binding protein